MNTFTTFRVIFAAALVCLALGPIGSWLARRLGLVDVPGSAPHKLHNSPVPIAGGMVLFLAVFAVSLAEGVYQLPAIRPILLSASVVFCFGLLDDLKGLRPSWKLAGQVLATVVLISSGVYVRLFPQDWLNILITFVWMVGITNAYNFVDSMDGLAIGLAAMASAFFMLTTIDSQQGNLSLFSTVLLGACFGSFYYNAAPARFFMGDSGAQFIGFTLAALGIAYNPLGFTRLASWYVPILLVGAPIFDATLVVISRLRRGRPIYQASRDHTYHRLVALGMNPSRAVLSIHIVSLLLGCLAFIALPMPPLIGNAIFAAVVLAGIGGILYLDDRRRCP